MARLLADIRACRVCADQLGHEPRPIVQAHGEARILIVGQAPGRLVHETGAPFNDPSGDRLRAWMGIERATFYDETKIAIAAMGFCFPGVKNGADLPPRPECAPLWRPRLMPLLARVRLTLVIGAYAQRWHLAAKAGVTETVRAWDAFGPTRMPLPHPSWRNSAWLKRNPWFEAEALPALRARVAATLGEELGGASD